MDASTQQLSLAELGSELKYCFHKGWIEMIAAIQALHTAGYPDWEIFQWVGIWIRGEYKEYTSDRENSLQALRIMRTSGYGIRDLLVLIKTVGLEERSDFHDNSAMYILHCALPEIPLYQILGAAMPQKSHHSDEEEEVWLSFVNDFPDADRAHTLIRLGWDDEKIKANIFIRSKDFGISPATKATLEEEIPRLRQESSKLPKQSSLILAFVQKRMEAKQQD